MQQPDTDEDLIRTPRTRRTLSLFPARLLLAQERLQVLLDALPAGSFVLCLPSVRDGEQHPAWDAIAWSVRALGRPTFIFSTAELERALGC